MKPKNPIQGNKANLISENGTSRHRLVNILHNQDPADLRIKRRLCKLICKPSRHPNDRFETSCRGLKAKNVNGNKEIFTSTLFRPSPPQVFARPHISRSNYRSSNFITNHTPSRIARNSRPVIFSSPNAPKNTTKRNIFFTPDTTLSKNRITQSRYL